MAPSTDDSLDYNAHLAFFERILIAGGLISVATVSYLALGPTMTDYFQYHPIFISMAFYFCMPLSLWYGRIGSRSLTIGARRQLLWRHLVISIGFSVFSICSFLAINAQKNHMKKQHYTSWHGFCGITVYIIIWLQSLVGFLRYFKPPVAASVQRFGRTIHSIAGSDSSLQVPCTYTTITLAGLVHFPSAPPQSLCGTARFDPRHLARDAVQLGRWRATNGCASLVHSHPLRSRGHCALCTAPALVPNPPDGPGLIKHLRFIPDDRVRPSRVRNPVMCIDSYDLSASICILPAFPCTAGNLSGRVPVDSTHSTLFGGMDYHCSRVPHPTNSEHIINRFVKVWASYTPHNVTLSTKVK